MTNSAAGNIALPLDDEQTARLEQAISGLSPLQLQWVSGYVAGVAAADPEPPLAAVSASHALTVLYGSQTGNGQAVAEALAATAQSNGFAVRIDSLSSYKPSALKRESLIALVVSTHGEGDPPDDAELFHEYLLSDKAPRLTGLRYSVLALGDSSYVNYCQTGREFDQRLDELGAERLTALVECDLNYDQAAQAWADGLLERLPGLLDAEPRVPRLHAVPQATRYDKYNPFPATVLVNQKITGAGSSKDVRHIELSLEESGIRYEPGDAIAVVAQNPPQLVAQILEELDFDGDRAVAASDAALTVREALTSELEITVPNLGFLRAWAEFSGADGLQQLLQPGQQSALAKFVANHQIIDIVRKYPATLGVEDFVNSLRTLMPRSYSIASSQAANPDEVHLTVAAVRYEAFGSEHWGAASTHLIDRVAEGDTVPVFVERNPRFGLPDNDRPIIMIGPGTGVAPFRAFVEERAERGASGKNWLFFGDRNFSSDFLYQLEWQRHLKRGNLQRLDVAFSRDQAAKQYVQHRLAECGADVFRWLQEGAVIYVCGDASHMAGDVDAALSNILVTHGGRDRDAADAELKELRRAGRYQRDVY